ncbi:NADPH:quinone reductase [Arthrobacter cryoconiti]|uniref:NADPH:quinone reductase n=1 Tax=Arthrobacter cryoconiti TaxID=748907 RepID=A0ABV8QX18_9MICC|nr:NADPH:quinone reductase [Arthrobacter cryoconiti]MCC9067384.1 NADPH:quinone reductase [Arthrobacter cryoconiti]
MTVRMMNAAYFNHVGEAGVITYAQLPVPQPGPGTALVRVRASAVNHVDTFVRSGSYATSLKFPQVLGRDLVGTVAAVGPGTPAHWSPGDAVWSNSAGFDGRAGAAAEFTVVPLDRLYRLPDSVDAVEAAAVLHSGATAWLALHRHARIRAAESVFVGGAAGAVGSALLIAAVRAGARVIVSARTDDAEYCRSLGACVALDYSSQTFDDELKAAVYQLTEGRGLDVHIETSGRHHLELTVELMALRGRIIALSGIAATNAVPLGKLYTRDGSIRGFAISNATVPELADAAAAVNALLVDGSLRSRHINQLPLSQAATAHALLEAGTGHGKLVLIP